VADADLRAVKPGVELGRHIQQMLAGPGSG
jgi:hypothetical protein